MPATIAIATTPEDLSVARMLFREYAATLAADLSTQNFEAELAGLPGKYALPRGCIILARDADEPVGCVALRPLDGDACEMKRLYVRSSQRGTGLGRLLALRLIEEARLRNYGAMRLDTIPALMGNAAALYRSLGFVNIPAYWDNVLPGVEYMELRL